MHAVAALLFASAFLNRNTVLSGEVCCPGLEPETNFCLSNDSPYLGEVVPRCFESLPSVTMTYYTNDDNDTGQPISRNTIPATFNSTQTVFLVHEWLTSPSSQYVKDMKDSLMEDYEALILVNWSIVAKNVFYHEVIADSQTIAKEMSLVMKNIMNFFNLISKLFHCVGLGFGGQICGMTGNYEKLGLIMALDPTGFGFEGRPPEGRLSRNSADVVGVPHTSAIGTHKTGMVQPCGTVDFYPNKGGNQPECNQTNPLCTAASYLEASRIIDNTPVLNILEYLCGHCDHFASVRQWLESRTSDTKCASYQNCTYFFDLPNSCSPRSTEPLKIIGYPEVNDAEGVFYLTTNDKKPYCQG